MAIKITGYTALRCKAIEDSSIVDGDVVGNDLILTKYDGSTINAGNVRGPQGPTGNPPLVSALPGSPTDGEEVYYQSASMATAGVCWHLKYRSAGTTYKWEFVGGGNLYHGGQALDSAPGGDGVWTELSVASPTTITVPLAGVYDVWFGASLQENLGNAVSGDIFVALYKNGVGVTNQSEAWDRLTLAYEKASIRNIGRLTFAANDVLRPRGCVSSGSWNNYRWKSAFVSATPVKLG